MRDEFFVLVISSLSWERVACGSIVGFGLFILGIAQAMDDDDDAIDAGEYQI